MILPPQPPSPLQQLLNTLSFFLDSRHSELMEPLFLGLLFAHGRRTATAWFRAGGIADQFRRAYTLLGTIGRSQVDLFAAVLFMQLRRSIPPGQRWLFALDDSPTQRYGPCVEGAGIHHNPTPGPTHQRHLYGHVWVTLAWVVNHPNWHVRALPLLADLYIRQIDIDKIDADRRPLFATKLEQAARQIHWLAEELQGTPLPIWLAVDGFYAKRPVLQAARLDKVVIVGRLRYDAALWDLPPEVAPQERGPGRPRVYGRHRLSLAKRAAHRRGWQDVECCQYQERVCKTIKTFLATWKPAGGMIRVVLVREKDNWIAYFCTDAQASVQDILEAAAGRTSIEDTFKDVKEVEGAGQQQLRYWRANVGAFHCCLWGYTAVEWWAWERPFEELCDRSESPWDKEERRPSHADKRKALQGEMLACEFWRRWGDQACPPKIRELVEAVLALAV
jgi:DDE superfamily endonuclease